MKRFLITTGAAAVFIALGQAAIAQQQCYNVVAFVSPNPLKCQQVGVNNLGKPIWLCCP
jgi:hypothetical protein